MKLKYFLMGLIGLSIISTSCKKEEDPQIPNEEEVITTLIYTLISHDMSDTVVMRFQDLDGDGGNNPIIMGGTLMANTMYHGELELLNEVEGEDITQEIKDEAEEHQFFFQVKDGLDAMVTYDDMDMDGNPIGLMSNLDSKTVSAGKLTITLRHEPAKDAPGVSDGNIANAGGETDIEVTFDVDIQ